MQKATFYGVKDRIWCCRYMMAVEGGVLADCLIPVSPYYVYKRTFLCDYCLAAASFQEKHSIFTICALRYDFFMYLCGCENDLLKTILTN